MKVKTRSGAKEAKRLEPAITVEQLNPRSRAVKSLEMAVKRGVVLSEMIDKHMIAFGERAAALPPERWSQAGSDLTEVWGKNWRNHPEYKAWPITYQQWATGALRRSIDDAMLNLPTESRDKVADLVRKRYVKPDQEA